MPANTPVHTPADTAEPPPAPGPSGPAPRPSRFRRGTGAVLDRWPFRRKLNVLVIVPVVAVGALLGVGLGGQVDQARAAGRVAELVRDSEQVARLINDIQAEHRQALLLSVQYESGRPGVGLPSTAAYRRAQRVTDAQAAAVRSAFGSSLPAEEAQALRYIGDLSVLRERLARGYVPAANIDPAYAAAVDYLIDGLGLGRYADSSSTSVINLLDTVLRADAAHAAFESSLFSAQTRDANAITEFTRAVGAYKLYEYQSDRFGRIATPGQVLLLDGIRRSSEQNGLTSQFAGLQIDPGSLQGQSPQQLRKAIDVGTRQAETRLGITRSLIGQIAARADTVSGNALRKALALLGLALLCFAGWLTFCVLVRRSVVRPLAELTDTAQQVVDVAGEELARISDDDESADRSPLRPRAIPVPVRDEIGRLAEAFNQVQVTAAQLLERQVLSRRNVAEMFGNVGRRVSNLTSRQLILIDAVEREETEPDVLERLYRIDHIAVRLQRNADSLMLLAGIRETGVEARPAAIANVIRAALGQIEGYQRVTLRSETEVTVAPDIIGDLTLMLAELLENAVTFSPDHAPVEVVVRPGTEVTADGGALIEVIDHGLGMSAERLAEENARLIRRERLDLVPTKVLGLFVIGSLARRWGIRVTLNRTPGGGVTSTVWIPATLLLAMNPANPATSPAADLAGSVTTLPARSGRDAAATPPVPASVASAPVVPAPVTPASAPPEQQAAGTPEQDGLPRRVRSHAGTRQPAAPEEPPAPRDAQGPQGPRPLRRRVRGATLAMTTAPGEGGPAAVRQPADAEAVRSELEEFEDAVRRAELDSGHPQPEPAPARHQEPRKEPGSDHVDR